MPQPNMIIEDNQRLSQSILWRLQRQFFTDEGITAWREEIVPQYITSNPHIAQAYARVIFGWLRDVADTLDLSQPIYIVELGAGSGRLAYHFLKSFFDFFETSTLSHISITYILTDFSQSTVKYWQNHEQLKIWVEAGKLDFALFDAESDDNLKLIQSSQTLSSDTLKNPVAFLANYFFDGLRQDVFRISNGNIHESLITLSTDSENPNLDDPAIFDDLDISFQHRGISTDYYDDSFYNQLLAYYRDRLDLTYLVFPIGSLQCFDRLLAMTNNRLFMLTGDKGYHLDEDVEGRGEPTIRMHGSFSMMVNYHAIGQYAEAQGGTFLSTRHHHASLDICAFVFGADPISETQYAYQREVGQASPDDWYTLKHSIDEQDDALSIREFLAYLRLSHWDSSIFLDYLVILLDEADDISESMRHELFNAIHKVWDMHYDIGEDYDLADSLGRLLYALDYPEEAIPLFRQSLKTHGADATVLFNVAMCYFELNELHEALDLVNQSLLLDPSFDLAQSLLDDIEGELE